MKGHLKSLFCLALAAVLMISFSGISAADDKDPSQFKVYWKDGIRLDSADKNFKLKIGGRIMSDWLWGSADEDIEDTFGEIVSGSEFRRARLYVSGTVYGNVTFKAQYDFAGGDADFKDMYVGLKTDIGEFKVGHFHVGFGLNELTSSKYITFIERALPMHAFAPSRKTGFAVMGSVGESKKEYMAYQFGAHIASDDYGVNKAHDDAYMLNGRITFVPWMEGKNFVHLGGAFVYQDVKEGSTLRYRSRAENHMLNRYVDTHSFGADSQMLFGGEFGFGFNGLHGAAEYVMASTDSPEYDDPSFQGFYGYLGYFLTGETRAYKGSAGKFNRTKVKNPFSKDGGLGAWEVAVRYSYLDLSDNEIEGGELMDITAALNWYLNNNTAVKFNWVYADVDEFDDGTANIFQVRFQVDF